MHTSIDGIHAKLARAVESLLLWQDVLHPYGIFVGQSVRAFEIEHRSPGYWMSPWSLDDLHALFLQEIVRPHDIIYILNLMVYVVYPGSTLRGGEQDNSVVRCV